MTVQPGASAGLPVARRHDYAFPFRVDPTSGRTTTSAYAAHVEQMIRQLLLTSPGERVNLPDFGCGLRELVFAPASDAFLASVRIRIRAGVDQWLGDHVELRDVSVETDAPEPGTVQVTVAYTLIESMTPNKLTVTVM